MVGIPGKAVNFYSGLIVTKVVGCDLINTAISSDGSWLFFVDYVIPDFSYMYDTIEMYSRVHSEKVLLYKSIKWSNVQRLQF